MEYGNLRTRLFGTTKTQKGTTVKRDEVTTTDDEGNETTSPRVVVNMQHGCKNGDNRYQVGTELDFSACSDDEIIKLAAESAIITWRRKVNFLGAASIETLNNCRVNVKIDLIESSRERVTNVEKGKRITAALTDAEKLELIAMMQASMTPADDDETEPDDES